MELQDCENLIRRALRRHWPAWPREAEVNLRGETAPECSESDRWPSGRSKAPYGLLSSSFHMIAIFVLFRVVGEGAGSTEVGKCYLSLASRA